MIRTFFIIILLGLVGYGVFYFSQERLSELVIENQKITFGNEEDKYSIEVNFPIIIKGIPKKSLTSINKHLSIWANTESEKINTEFLGLSKKLKNIPTYASLTYLSEYKTDYDFSFSPFINFQFENYSYTGGAHGGTQLRTFVFNAKTGEKITLDHILNENYLEKLSGLALQEIKKEDPELETYIFAEDGLKPQRENFESWEILKEGIKFTFGDYQIGPYASGRPQIILSWQDLDLILKPEFKSNLILAK